MGHPRVRGHSVTFLRRDIVHPEAHTATLLNTGACQKLQGNYEEEISRDVTIMRHV